MKYFGGPPIFHVILNIMFNFEYVIYKMSV